MKLDLPPFLLVGLALVWVVYAWREPKGNTDLRHYAPALVITFAAIIIQAGLTGL